MRNDLEAARANAEQAKFDYERAKQNFDAKILAEADYQKAKSTSTRRSANARGDRAAAASERCATLAAQPRLALEDDRHVADRRRRHRAPRQGRRGHGHRHDEQRRDAAPDDLGHVRGRGGDDGGRDVRAAGQGRPDREPFDRRLSRTRRSRALVTEVGSSPIQKNDPDLLSLTQGSEAINFKVKIRVQDPPDTIRPGLLRDGRDRDGRKDGATGDPDPGARRPRRARRRTAR